MYRALLLGVILSFLGACGFVHDERIDGPYRLVAVDVMEEMSVCYDLGDACVGRIPETVYAVGFDAKYLVAARHPNNDPAVSEFYYLARELDSAMADPSESVQGPFDSKAFEAERERLGLPPLTRTL